MQTRVQPRNEIKMPTIESAPIVPLDILMADTKLLIMGDTGAGKTGQIGLLAEYLYVLSGGTKKTVLFTMDEGGFLTIKPLVDLGVIEIVKHDGKMPPWIWVSHALKGEALENGEWVKKTDPETCALAAYEGLTAFSEFMLEDLSRHSATHPTQTVGGDSAWQFQSTYEGETIKMASNTMSHYGLVQMRIMHEILKAKPGVPSIWTSVLTRSTDPLGGGILGPQTVGKSQAPTIPRLFDLSFRIDAETNGDQPSTHTLFLETHEDKAARGARVNVNTRVPLSGGNVIVTTKFAPANIIVALQQLQARHEAAKSDTQSRLARLLGQTKKGR